ncbi:uncharacterized protein LOC111314763 [Durio zibethinus]|uniref:Uncharacterized protein LOC111314763 n=1 Tax=Durio zibethinus TaxID=66656 RepID=A0A6P6B4M2_DURZI|nr:uncharacterized protein LOC111314763 [Durio zibethinus]
MSALQLNYEKSELYQAGVSKEELVRIQQASGFKIGTLPVRYLGVPLVSRRLTEKDCAPLVDKITARINSWATRHLSYAGRLQLAFHPPKTYAEEDKQVMFWFLLEKKTCVLQNIWLIIAKADSLWIAWIEAYELKGKTIWQVAAKQTSSWNWRKLLQIRLPMKDRLRSWGMRIDSRCNLCYNEDETRDHVYFECVYSKEVWQKILQLCNIDRRVRSWDT